MLSQEMIATGAVAIGYTIGTGRLYCPIEVLQTFLERLLERDVMTHEIPQALEEARWVLEETFTQMFGGEDNDAPNPV